VGLAHAHPNHMHNNLDWHFYGPPPPHYSQGMESGTNPSKNATAGEVGPTVTAKNTQQNVSGKDKLVMYNASIKVLYCLLLFLV